MEQNVTERMARLILAERPMMLPGAVAVAVAILLVGSAAFGAWWTAAAVAAGDPAQVILRFGVSIILGLYYLVLFRVVRGRAQ